MTTPAPAYDRHGVQVHHGDCLDVMRQLPDASVHAIVTDPPAGIRFMNRAWDSDMGGRHSWVAWLSERMREAHRVLKPGGYGLVWAMPRTSHWTAWALEDAGFEVRDCVVHLFGNGFPKSLDVSKAIDKQRDDQADVDHVREWLNEQRKRVGLTLNQINQHFGHATNGGGSASSWMSNPTTRNLPTWEQWEKLRDLIGFGDDMDAEVWRLNGRKGTPGEAWAQRKVIGQSAHKSGIANGAADHYTVGGTRAEHYDITAPATTEAERWSGWGTALKPAAEHWWLIRKPLSGTVASNVQTHDTGALNIAAASVADRWPPNTVVTHDAQCSTRCVPGCPAWGMETRTFPTFRYEPKASKAERPMVGGKSHETVKPIALMRWMVRLVCVPDGTVLDCFAGSGTTGQAARAEGMRAVLIEADPDHIDKIRARLDARPKTTAAETAADEPMDLLDLLNEEAS